MRRILVGVTTSLAIWFGSALAVEAQQITPIGPTAYIAGSTTSTYTATIYMPTPSNYKVNTQIYKNNVFQTGWSQNVPNPGTSISTFSQVCDVTFSVAVGDVVRYEAQLLIGRSTYYAPSWSVTVTATRIPTKTDPSTKKIDPIAKRTSLALSSIDRDRRRDE
jgi:hypothetical protein